MKVKQTIAPSGLVLDECGSYTITNVCQSKNARGFGEIREIRLEVPILVYQASEAVRNNGVTQWGEASKSKLRVYKNSKLLGVSC